MAKETDIGLHVRGRHLFDKVRCGIFNATNGAIKVSGVAISSQDTEFTYVLKAEAARALNKAQLDYCRTLARGIAIGAELDGHLINTL